MEMFRLFVLNLFTLCKTTHCFSWGGGRGMFGVFTDIPFSLTLSSSLQASKQENTNMKCVQVENGMFFPLLHKELKSLSYRCW
jgi:hypothetical protein